MYAEVAGVFDNADGTTHTALILPKLQLNSKTTIESLNSNLAKVALAGTGQLVEVKDGSVTRKTPFYIDPAYTLPVAGA